MNPNRLLQTSPFQTRLVLPGLAAALAVLASLAIAALPPVTSLVLAAGTAIVLAILIRPWLGLPLLALAIPFAAVKPLPLGSLPVDGADLLLLLVVGAWLAQGVARRAIVLPRAPLVAPLSIFGLVIALSLPGAVSFRDGIPELVKWLQVLVLYWCVAAILPRRNVGWLLAALLVAGVAQALLGIYQFITQSGPEGFILLGRFMRAFGTFRQPNPYAGYLGLVAPLAVSLTLWAWTTRKGQAPAAWLRAALPAAAAITSLGLLLSWSRGAWLAFGAAIAVVILAHTRRAAPLVLVAGALLLLLGLIFGLADLLPASLVDRVSELGNYVGMIDVRHIEINDANFSVVERIAHWEAALGMWARQPWLGVGIGNYAAVYPAYALPRWSDPLGHAHNVYLNFGAETGLVGLLAYLALWVAAIWQTLRVAASGHRFVAAVGAGVLGALTHATVHNLFDNLWVQHMYLQLALLLGLLAVLARPEERKDYGGRPATQS